MIYLFLATYLIVLCERSLAYSVSENGRFLSSIKATSVSIRIYYYSKLIGKGLLWPIFSLISIVSSILEIVKKEEQEEELEDLP